MDAVIAVLMIGMGLAIAGVWTRDILVGNQVDLSSGIWRARDQQGGTLLWPHWLAEYSTAVLLLVGGVALQMDTGRAAVLAALALGALFYTSINSLGWAFAARERLSYAPPMIAGVIVSLAGAVHLLLR